MQNLNFLYSVEKSSPIYMGKHGYRINVELYDTTSKVEQIAAYNFHPNKTTLCSLVINWFIELIYGRTTVLVRVEGQSSDLYVRVNDLSRALNISAKSIVEESKKGDMTQFLINHQTINKIKKLVEQQQVEWTGHLEAGAQKVIKQIGYRNAFKAMENAHFDSKSMALTLIEVGRDLANHRVPDDERHPNAYKFKIDLPNIFVWEIVSAKKTTMNLVDLTVKEEDLLVQAAERIERLARADGIQWDQIAQQGVKKIIREIGYRSALHALDCNEFEATRMACTLVEIGKELMERASVKAHEHSYQYKIDLPSIYVWKVEDRKKIKLDLPFRDLTREDSSPEAASPSFFGRIRNAFRSDKKESKEEKKTNETNEREAFEIDARDRNVHSKEQLKYLGVLAKQIGGYSNMRLTLDQIDEDKKLIMLNTFVEIGKELSSPSLLERISSRFRLRYTKRKKIPGKSRRITHTFAINKEDIYIVQGKFGEGGFKDVSDAIHLNNLNSPFVRHKFKHDVPIADKHKTCVAVKEIKKERSYLDKLHKKGRGADCIVPPFACEIQVDKNKNDIILFQKKCRGGDGIGLKTAPLSRKVQILRDIAQGLAFVHSQGLVHMDMKPANFLIDDDKGKVSDFGLTVETGNRVPGGTYIYLAPECLNIGAGRRVIGITDYLVNDKVDCFAFGITLLEVLSNATFDHSWGTMNQIEIDAEIARYGSMLRASTPQEGEIHVSLLNVVRRLIRHDAASRISCADAAALLEEICTRL